MPCRSLQLENTAMFSDAGGQIQRPAEAKHFFLEPFSAKRLCSYVLPRNSGSVVTAPLVLSTKDV